MLIDKEDFANWIVAYIHKSGVVVPIEFHKNTLCKDRSIR